MSVVLHREHYIVDKKPFFQHFHPKDLAITATRSVVIQGLNVLNDYVSTMDLSDHENSDDSDKEDADEKAIFRLPAAREFYISCTKLFVKSLSISTCLRCAEVVCIRIFSFSTVSRLIKDVGRSAVRKYHRTGSRSSAAFLMVKTGMWASVLSHIAIFIVEEVTQIAQILYRQHRMRALSSSSSYSPLFKNRKEMDFFLQITYKNATRCALSIVTSGTAAAIGSFLRPGKGTNIGATIGDSIVYAL